jgi:hypothetical protein
VFAPTQHPGSFSSFLPRLLLYVPDILVHQPDSVHSVEDALAHILHPRPVQVSQSCLGEASEASHQPHIEVLPSVLVLHLKRFVYDAATDDIVKVRKPIQFAPELEFPLGMIYFLVSLMPAKSKNLSWLCWHRNDGARCREIC